MARLPQNSLSLDRLFANDDTMIDPTVADQTHHLPVDSEVGPGGELALHHPGSLVPDGTVPTTDNESAHPSGNMPDKMDQEDYEFAINQAIRAAEDFVDTQLSPDRNRASEYYRGELFGDEEEGKSQVVMTEVRDSVLALMPGLLRVFCGSQDPVEFIANGGTDADGAAQRTDYINHIFMVDNPGFMIMHNAIKDALVRKTGIITWWHEEKEIVTQVEFSDLPPDALTLLQQETSDQSDNSKYIQYEVRVDPNKTRQDVDDNGLPISFSSGVVLKRQLRKRFRVRSVPPEEFIVTPAVSNELEDFQLVGHRTITTVSKLVEDGYDINAINDAIGASATNGGVSNLDTNIERLNRDEYALDRIFDSGFGATDPASRNLKVVTVYCQIDKDGDGIAERRKIVTIGDSNKPIYDEMCGDELTPYAVLCPDPEPHTPIGYSIADQVQDLQEIKSQLVRRTLDSLDQSINQRMAVVEGQVNLDDAMNLENGAIIRMKQQGAVQQLTTVFQGQQAMPVIAYFDEVKARRTGITMGPTGLSAEVLQSTATAAVSDTIDASQERAEMIARIFAETGITRLFRGLLQLVCTHQDFKRVLRLKGQVVTVDPRSWDADLDVQCNVGTGRGKTVQKIQSLMTILGMQKEVISNFGPSNPIVGLDHLSYTASQIVKEMGYSDPSKFFNIITKDQADKIKQFVSSQPKKPTPEELLAQAQHAKIEADRQTAKEKITVAAADAVMRDSREREKMLAQHSVAAATAIAEYGAQVNDTELAHQEAIDAHVDNAVKSDLANQKMQQDAEIAQQQAEAQAAAAQAKPPQQGPQQ